jgi:molecular chaperone GrpE (heat shock protein)
MAVKTREELLESIRDRVGEQTDDETISFLEDVTDTLTDLETRANGDGENWEQRYKDNDAEWRKKYTERFFSSVPIEPPEPKPKGEEMSPKTFEDLFK